jgi:hypothetical protein
MYREEEDLEKRPLRPRSQGLGVTSIEQDTSSSHRTLHMVRSGVRVRVRGEEVKL